MSHKHEEIVRKIMIRWTEEKRGRLFKNDNGKAWRGRITEERMIDGRKVLELFGAVTIKYGLFPGSSDLVGWEFIRYGDQIAPVFCAVEVKTKGDRVRDEQRNWLDAVSRMGGRAYLAREEGEEYTVEEWVV
jgi:hypothetical protein